MTDKQPRDKMTMTVFALMAIIGGIGFWLSYDALMSLAHEHGKAGARGYGWPLIIDLPIIAFSLAGVIAARRNVSAMPPRVVVALASVATVAYNWYHAYNVSRDIWYNVIAVSVAVAAPVMYFAAFEISLWLVGILRDTDKTPGKAPDIASAEPDISLTNVLPQADKPVTNAPKPRKRKKQVGKMSQAERWQIIKANRDKTRVELAELAGVTPRTIGRDIKDMAEMPANGNGRY